MSSQQDLSETPEASATQPPKTDDDLIATWRAVIWALVTMIVAAAAVAALAISNV